MLSVRGREPRKGMLDSFGGFVDDDETSEQTVARELNEELGLNPEDYEPVTYICSGAGTYPYEGEVLPVVANFYYTRLTGSKDPQPDDDVAGIRTVPLHEVDMAEVHDEDVRLGIRQLQKIIDNTAAAEKE
jgi:8-oxo-dGTP pyrophosphatase MutT (NUDIX family)